MRTSSFVLQIIGIGALVGGIIFGILLFASVGIWLIVGGVIVGVALWGFGAGLQGLADIASDARRSADALERLAKTQPMAEVESPVSTSRIKPLT